MWWYRDQKKNSTSGRDAGAVDEAASDPSVRLLAALTTALSGRPATPDGLLAMCLLVDHHVVLSDGTCLPPHSWQEAERLVARALGPDRPARLYNLFARDFGDGCSVREDLPEDQAHSLTRLRAELLRSNAISALERDA